MLESAVGVSGSYHSTMYAATNTSVDLSTASQSVHSHPAAAIASSRCEDDSNDDVGDTPRLTAVYVQSKKSASAARTMRDDVIGQRPSLALSSFRPSPSGSIGSSHHTSGQHRQTLAQSRTLPQIVDGGDGVGGGRQRVSFQVAEPRSQSSTCIAFATADALPRWQSNAADADHHRTSSVDDMRTCRTPDRSPKQPRRDPRTVQTYLHRVDVAAHTHDVNTTLGDITAPSSQQTDSVD